MKVVVANCVTLNGGDAAILSALLQSVAEAWGQAEVTVFDAHAGTAGQRFESVRVVPSFAPARVHAAGGKRRWLERRVLGKAHFARLLSAALLLRRGLTRAAQALCDASEFERLCLYRDADVVVSTGGTYLVPTYNLDGKVFELAMAHVFGVPLMLYTQSIGKLRGHPNADALRFCLERARLILLRDERSLENLRDLGVDTARCLVRPDAVLGGADEARLSAPRSLPERGLDVVISVRSWSHFASGDAQTGMARYREAVARAVSWLVRECDAQVLFLSTCQGIDRYGFDDSRVADEVAVMLDPEVRARVTVDQGQHRHEELSKALGRADLVIATRMHMAILGLCAGVPVLPIAYEFKTEELFSSLGFSDWVERIDEVTADSLVGRVGHVLRQIGPRRAALSAAVLDQKRRAQQASGAMAAALAAHEAESPAGWMWARVAAENGWD